jgi:hypothetical protein
MKIQVFVRSADWLHSAGTRIRYRRLQPEFARLGYSLAIDPISTIREGLKLNADIYLFSKCQDAGALMLADMLREAGALVGFDLFDDYISGDSSITFAQRDFQRSLSGRVDFLLCSTERMSTVARLMFSTIRSSQQLVKGSHNSSTTRPTRRAEPDGSMSFGLARATTLCSRSGSVIWLRSARRCNR